MPGPRNQLITITQGEYEDLLAAKNNPIYATDNLALEKQIDDLKAQLAAAATERDAHKDCAAKLQAEVDAIKAAIK